MAKKVFVLILVIYALYTNCVSLVEGQEKLLKNDHEFPWLVAMHHRVQDVFFCAGSLISVSHVLSAAHCFQPKLVSEKLKPFEVLVKLGRFNLSDSSETEAVDSLLWDIIIHPDWSFNNDNYDADIAVLVLDKHMRFSVGLQAIKLPDPNYDAVEGTGVVVGWGKSEDSAHRQYELTPTKVNTPAVNASHCYTTFPKLSAHSSNRVFCGGYENRDKAPCLGDSGGGFYLKQQSSWTIIGIISGSLYDNMSGCDINKFSLYANVARYVEWIRETMGETRKIVWKYVDYDCEKYDFTPRFTADPGKFEFDTACQIARHEATGQNVKIKADLSTHNSIKTPDEVKKLELSPSPHHLFGIGEAFPNLQKLEYVKASRWDSIEKNNFNNMEHLRELILEGNIFSFLSENAFEDLVNLESLDLSYCSLQKLHEEQFKGLQELKKLSLGNNPITLIPEKVFGGLVSLELLELENCRLEMVDAKSFAPLINLKSLSLNKNPIKTIPLNTFQNLKSLERLDFHKCEIEEIPASLLKDLSKLKTLNINTNPITVLDEETFAALEDLEFLNAQHCKLQELPENIFKTNSKLSTIYLNDNHLKKIHVDFTKLINVEIIYLSRNVCTNEEFRIGEKSIQDFQNSIERSCE